MLNTLVLIFTIPLLLLNLLSAVVGVVWLGFEGSWSIIFQYFISLFALSFIPGLSMIPALPLLGLLKFSYDNRNRTQAILWGTLTLIYGYTVTAIGISVVFNFFANKVDGLSIPYLLIAYAAAIGPWAASAARDGSESKSGTVVFGAQIGVALSMTYYFFSENSPTLTQTLLLLAIPMTFMFILDAITSLSTIVNDPLLISRKKDDTYKHFKKTLAEASQKLSENNIISSDISDIAEHIEKIYLTNQDRMAEIYRRDGSLENYVYSSFINRAGDLLEMGTGQPYLGMVKRNILNIQGESLLAIFDRGCDELVKRNHIDLSHANNLKQSLRKNIQLVV